MTAERSFFDVFQKDIKNTPKLNLNNINKSINYSDINKINELINQLRKQDFDYVHKNQEGKDILIKYHDENANEDEDSLNPISPNEEEIQGLFFLRAMLLIAENDQRLKVDKIIEIFNKNKHSTLLLADKFINILKQNLNISHEQANTQLTMAKDLSILMADHPAIYTISEEQDKITIEKSTPYKIREEYYNNNIFVNNADLKEQSWYKNAKKFAGFKDDQQDTWLDNFFANKKNQKIIREKGVSAPPSARWWPTPPNNQLVEIDVFNKTNNNILHTEFLRTGIAVAYDIRKIDDKNQVQKDLAAAILKELITSQLETRIKKFKELYGPIIDNEPNFYIDYQTLLSPLIGELHLPHIDNNAKFINIVKEAIDQVRNALSSEKLGVNLIIEHTNAAVNRNAYLSNEFSRDEKVRRKKIDDTKSLSLPDEQKNPALYKEIKQRKLVCDKLEALLDNNPPYDKLERYQRNIMMSALEHLVMGMQCVNLVGCKSARDRTGIFEAAIKVMLEDPNAMDDWKVLEKGIAKSLKQGHAFRSMIFHNAVLKVSMVHKNFMKMLNSSIQKEIKSLLIYARKLPEYPKVSSTKKMYQVFSAGNSNQNSNQIIARRKEYHKNNEKAQVVLNYKRKNQKLGSAKLSQGTNIKISVDSDENKSQLTSDLRKLKNMSVDKQRLVALDWILESSGGRMPKNQVVQLSAYENLPTTFLMAIKFYLEQNQCDFKLINGKGVEDSTFKSTLSPSSEEKVILEKIYNNILKPKKENQAPPTISFLNKKS